MGKKKEDVLNGLEEKKLRQFKKSLINVSKEINLCFDDLLINNVLDIAKMVAEGLAQNIIESIDEVLAINELKLLACKMIKEKGVFNPKNLRGKSLRPDSLWQIADTVTDFHRGRIEKERREDFENMAKDQLRRLNNMRGKCQDDMDDVKDLLDKKIKTLKTLLNINREPRIQPRIFVHPETLCVTLDFQRSTTRSKNFYYNYLLESTVVIIKMDTGLPDEFICEIILRLFDLLDVVEKEIPVTYVGQQSEYKCNFNKNKYILKRGELQKLPSQLAYKLKERTESFKVNGEAGEIKKDVSALSRQMGDDRSLGIAQLRRGLAGKWADNYLEKIKLLDEVMAMEETRKILIANIRDKYVKDVEEKDVLETYKKLKKDRAAIVERRHKRKLPSKAKEPMEKFNLDIKKQKQRHAILVHELKKFCLKHKIKNIPYKFDANKYEKVARELYAKLI